ncbi:MAG TPA: CHASE sensor domain-containing protein, partial [Sedimentisphaerales bacterium]|nr:CHASE sensor domain-containing protein [Sedimentisphaerales bacterium]
MKIKMTIRRKLIAVMMFICIFALATAATVFVLWSQSMYRRTTVDNLMIIASIIANQTRAAIVFEDAADAGETLASLKAQPSIVAANIHTKDGKLFVAYCRDGGKGGTH